MGLSSDLVSAFTKITNDSKPKKTNPSLYGTIVKYGEDLHVQLDGSNEVTPISRTVEVEEGDRVAVTIANHAATVTGNLSDPAIGFMKAGNFESNITQTAEQIRLEVADLEKKLSASITLTASEIRSELSDGINGLNAKITQTASELRSEISDTANGLQSSITQNTTSITSLVKSNDEFSEFKQTIEGFSFMGKGGTVKISGGDITLTGSITFTDLDEETQDKITEAADTADTANTNALGALTAAEIAGRDAGNAIIKAQTAQEAADAAYELALNGGGDLPDYLKSTYIDETTVMSPTIIGGQFYAVDSDSFAEMNGDGFYVYCEDMKNPKVKIAYTDMMVQLILGAGQDNDTSYKNRFFLQKGTDRVGIYYYDRDGNMSGFTLGEGSTITVHGTGIGGTGGTVGTAVWG